LARAALALVDLFCGAGGTSTGILKACDQLGLSANLIAVNHWTTAINTHALNHPTVRHICEPVENLHPLDLVKSGYLHLLAASCECRFHSRARGGGPCNEQSRSQPWQLIRWATDITVEDILMENVPEFVDWGPLNTRTKRPVKSKKGQYFRSFVAALQNLGYTVDWRVQNCADYGDATTRRRLILQARLHNPITWPEPTHGPGRAHPYEPFRKHWDQSIPGKSIFREDGTLRHCKNTIRRMIAGFEKQGRAAEPFLCILRGTSETAIHSTTRSIDEPLPTVTAGGGHMMICEPFLVQTDHVGRPDPNPRSLDNPIPSVVTKQNLLLVDPFLIKYHAGERSPRTHSVDEPIRTIDTQNRFAIVEPMVMKYYKSGICKSVNDPLDTVTTKARFLVIEPTTGDHYKLDIRTRMVQPHELAACHSFPKSYVFTGNKADQTKQIGNSVPVELACAHARAILS
jgi:DNA (cytosine-5)-methyltransferase 1